MNDAPDSPLPVQPLGYAVEGEDAWLTIVRAVSNATVVLCAARILAAMSQIASPFVGGAVSWRFPARASLEGLFFAIELAGVVVAALLLAGAIGARKLRPWSRVMLLWGAVAMIVLTVPSYGWTIFQVFTRAGFQGEPFLLTMFVTRAIGVVSVTLILPMLIIWLMRRAEVRQRFMGQVIG